LVFWCTYSLLFTLTFLGIIFNCKYHY
jgi:hypothetical protein